MCDDEIDTSDPDAPEVKDWSRAERGVFYRLARRLSRREVVRRAADRGDDLNDMEDPDDVRRVLDERERLDALGTVPQR